MKPLLGATRTSSEIKKRDEVIQKMNEKMRQDAADRQRGEEEMRNARTEVQRIQQTLESERALALDKDEDHEATSAQGHYPRGRLAGALEDNEKLEDQIDDLLAAKKKVEPTA